MSQEVGPAETRSSGGATESLAVSIARVGEHVRLKKGQSLRFFVAVFDSID